MKKHLIILFLILGNCLSMISQPVDDLSIPIDADAYPFIDMKYNTIQIPGGDSLPIKNFYRKVDHLIKHGDVQINVLHIGGSHVQADMFSDKVRRNLDAINESFQSQRGFVFPYTVAKTNNPTNYKVTYTGVWGAARNVQTSREISLGMGGIAVYTDDPTATIFVDLNPNDELEKRWTFDRLRLLGYPEEDGTPIRPVLFYNEETIDSYFDLITETYVFELPTLVDSFEIGFVSEDNEPHTFIVNGFIPEKDVPGITYHAIGVNGASTESYLNSEYFEKELSIIMPDMVIFGIGINDAAGKDFTAEIFHYNYSELLRRIKDVNPNCVFIFLTNNDSYKKIARRKYAVNRNGPIAQKVFYRLAEENQGGVWDLFALMGGLQSMAKWEKAGLAKVDKIHFTRGGYELLGDLLYNSLVRLYYEIELEE